MPGIVKPARQRNIRHGLIGLHQQIARLLQPQLHVIFLGRRVQKLAKQALKLARRDAQIIRDNRWGHGIVDPVFHDRNRLREMRIANTIARLQRDFLLGRCRAHGVIDHLIRHRERKLFAMIFFDQMQHQIGGRRAARGCDKGFV